MIRQHFNNYQLSRFFNNKILDVCHSNGIHSEYRESAVTQPQLCQVSIEEDLKDSREVSFQAALLYTSSKGERRIRVHTLCLPTTASLQEVVQGADQVSHGGESLEVRIEMMAVLEITSPSSTVSWACSPRWRWTGPSTPASPTPGRHSSMSVSTP